MSKEKLEIVFIEIKKLFSIKNNNGFSQKEVCRSCEKYGNLPEVLKQYYLQLGKIAPLNQSQNRLCRPNELIDAGQYVIFYVENQYVAQWAIKKSELDLENPPVYCSLDETNFKLECENLYDFLCAMANFQAASWGLAYSCEEFYYLEEEQLAQVVEHYQKKPYELHEWMDIVFYANQEDEVICVMGGEEMLYASSNRKHFEAIETFMGQMNLEVL